MYMENYYPVKEIGDGNHSVVWLMRHKDTDDLVAVKCIPRGDKVNEKMTREIINHGSLCHPNIIQFKEVVLTPTHLAIVMEHASGDLFDYLKGYGKFSEEQARYFFQQLISGISFCHNMEICHRDMKLENILLVGRCLKICDFGYSKSYLLHSRPHSKVGTPAYVAPEVLRCKEYDGKLADIWSCGVILYTMLVGAFPFGDQRDPQNLRKTIQQIATVQYKFPTDVHLSQGCKNLISRIFVANPSERITMKEIKSHPWFLKNLPKELTEEAQSVYYKKGKPTTSLQNTEDIINIVNSAKTLPIASKTKLVEFELGVTQSHKIVL